MKRIIVIGILTFLIMSTLSWSALSAKKIMPEFLDVSQWINSDPIERSFILGKVIVVHFWSLSSLESLRDMMIVKEWVKKYSVEGVEFIGIHTPLFDFEKDPKLIEMTLGDLGISHPIAIDNDSALWYAYNALKRPSHYLIDAEGRIRYTYQGETAYARQEWEIQDLLKESGRSVDLELEDYQAEEELKNIRTPTFYLGYRYLAYFGNDSKIKAEVPEYFKRPPVLYPNRFYLDGKWQIHEENLESLRPGNKLSVQYHARSVFVLMGSKSAQPLNVDVLLDGKYLTRENGGFDVSYFEGRSLFKIDRPRYYHVVDTRDSYGDHLLELVFDREGAKLFLVSFGGSPLKEKSLEKLDKINFG
ncbi:MAG: hypothetical protein JW893_01490 [Candidatus Omnitrophica bacterium]|nr:hypothetical protein [Candidatus Omnitrophota bacterium]